MNVIQALRLYLGMSQTVLAKEAGITQPDLSEMETLPPYGHTAKYLRLSEFLDVPVDALVKNDFTAIPESFFDRHPAPPFTPEPEDPLLRLGRQGEEFILRRERELLSDHYPALSKLVLPFYKMKGASPGYDILSFDALGIPIALEVKTASNGTQNFRLTSHELDTAKKLTEQGYRYIIVCITNWGKEKQTVQELSFQDLERTYSIAPHYYFCSPLPVKSSTPVCGLVHFRHARGLRQVDVAEALDVAPSNYCQYERGQVRPSITFYIRASQFYGVTVDALLATYDSEADSGD